MANHYHLLALSDCTLLVSQYGIDRCLNTEFEIFDALEKDENDQPILSDRRRSDLCLAVLLQLTARWGLPSVMWTLLYISSKRAGGVRADDRLYFEIWKGGVDEAERKMRELIKSEP